MTPKEAQQHLLDLFGQQLIFNNDFDKHFALLKEGMKENLLQWCADCKKGTAKGSVPDNPKYKDKFVFFRKIGGDMRCILIKIKNSEFIEINLVKHKEYDDIRLRLGYKKSSYYGS